MLLLENLLIYQHTAQRRIKNATKIKELIVCAFAILSGYRSRFKKQIMKNMMAGADHGKEINVVRFHLRDEKLTRF